MLEKGKVIQVNVNMGRPKFLFDIKPLFGYPLEIEGGRLLLNLISMGNPHCVCFLEQPVDDFPLTYLGPKVENHPLFPKRTNFEIANILGRREIRARVWERGAGETLSCGSGACAIGAVAYLQGYVDNDVDISFPGGTLKVSWGKGGDIYLTGPVTEVFNGEWG
jgi:diaminopimelate epimerase